MESPLEQLQRMIDSLYRETKVVTRLDVVVRSEAMDLPAELRELVELLPPGEYKRQKLCDQLNSAIVGHGWGGSLGTVE
jgi:hypothetical protein